MIKSKFILIIITLFILAAVPLTAYLTVTARDQKSRAAENASVSISQNTESTKNQVWDLNHDGRVNDLDLSLVMDRFGDKNRTAEDINQDGTVDMVDVSLIIDHWK